MTENGLCPLTNTPGGGAPRSGYANHTAIQPVSAAQQDGQSGRYDGVPGGTLRRPRWLQNRPLPWLHFRALPTRT